MQNLHRKNLHIMLACTAIVAFVLVVFAGCAGEPTPAWKAVSDRVVAEHNLTVRERTDMINTGITSNLEPGKVTNISTLPVVEFAPGVTGQMYWGRGCLVNFMTLEPNAEIPKETLPAERLMVMLKGSVEQLVNGSMEKMEMTEVAPMYYFGTGYVGYKHCLYLSKGTENAVKAGPDGAKFVEIYYPIRTDYMAKTGASVPSKTDFGSFNATPNFTANEVFNWWNIQPTQLVPGAECWSRLFNGGGVQMSMLFMGPETKFGHHIHPEEQLMIVLSGQCNEIILDGTQVMTDGDIVYLPSNMVHGGIMGPQGADVIDVFWPVRPDYQQKEKAQYDKFHAIVPKGTKAVLLADGETKTATNSKKIPGLQFTEGPAWMDGKLYFSSMKFDIPAGTWETDEKMCDTVVMEKDGTYSYIRSGMQTNGLMAKGNGNLVACDMAGGRVIEMAPNGRVVRVLASKLSDGTLLDGPNDLVIDAKGGIYFTDPQFVFKPLNRPTKTINYITPGGREVICVLENEGNQEFNMPNGLLLSPDGKTLYVNNTYHFDQKFSEAENWLYAFDVNEDGTLSNKRRHSQMFLHQTEYGIPQEKGGARSSCNDGLTIDVHGNVYNATNVGLQIFSPEGEFIGIIYTPTFPVSVCFGGDDFQTIYMTCWDKIYSIHTNVKGLVYPLQK